MRFRVGVGIGVNSQIPLTEFVPAMFLDITILTDIGRLGIAPGRIDTEISLVNEFLAFSSAS